MRLIAVGLLSVVVASAVESLAHANGKMLQITEKTKFYTIKGNNAAELAVSMGKKGPYSRQHKRRAWATAGRKMSYQLFHQKFKNNCRMKNVKVRLTITYTMPKLSRLSKLSKRERRKWNKMYAILNKHERTHGLYYKQLAKKVRSTVRRMKPARNCRVLEARADALVEKLSEQNKKRNQHFDDHDDRNYRRMERIYSGS